MPTFAKSTGATQTSGAGAPALGYFLWGKVLSMMPAATAGQVLMLTPIGGFVLSTLIFGGAVTADVLLSVALIVGGIFVTLRR